jgi:hypothetical protein
MNAHPLFQKIKIKKIERQRKKVATTNGKRKGP